MHVKFSSIQEKKSYCNHTGKWPIKILLPRLIYDFKNRKWLCSALLTKNRRSSTAIFDKDFAAIKNARIPDALLVCLITPQHYIKYSLNTKTFHCALSVSDFINLYRNHCMTVIVMWIVCFTDSLRRNV